MATEIELKLRLSRGDAVKIRQNAMLQSISPMTVFLSNTYFDTPDRELSRANIALRLRQKGDEWLTTVKGSDPNGGVLTKRQEWEGHTTPSVFNFSIVKDCGLRVFLESRYDLVKPVFSTDFERTMWRVPVNDSVVEICLDEGKIIAESNGKVRQDDICELEFELVSGSSVESLVDLARTLSQYVLLFPECASKAERGFCLAGDMSEQPFKATLLSLAETVTPCGMFKTIAENCLVHLHRNDRGLRVGADPEYLHQSRVAVRRLVTAFEMFAKVLPQAFVQRYQKRWAKLGSQLGAVRDEDVFGHLSKTFCHQFVTKKNSLFVARQLKRTKRDARRKLLKVISNPCYGELQLAFVADLWRLPTVQNSDGQGVQDVNNYCRQQLEGFARDLQQRLIKKNFKHPKLRHQLRLSTKRYRYCLEFSAALPLLKIDQQQLQMVVELQETLGFLNDLTLSATLAKRRQLGKRYIALFDIWLAGAEHELVGQLKSRSLAFIKSMNLNSARC